MPTVKMTHKPKLEVVANPKTEKGISPKQERFIVAKNSHKQKPQSRQGIPSNRLMFLQANY